ncbi:hypothetical protein ACFL27_00695 [candidate division CSSED10-310 bacterium]|uniref:Sugar ABC transporter permease n=1 Tax=candidate division CSSED10-310 bacterium TaxID=2855610 RepID=A0ABV6YRL0_UNCC1
MSTISITSGSFVSGEISPGLTWFLVPAILIFALVWPLVVFCLHVVFNILLKPFLFETLSFTNLSYPQLELRYALGRSPPGI